MKNKWVPVERALPPNDGAFFVTVETETGDRIAYMAFCSNGYWSTHSKVVAWLPIPEPFAGDSE